MNWIKTLKKICTLGLCSCNASEEAQDAGEGVTTKSGLQYLDLVVGDGDEATKGKQVAVLYTGWLTNGTMFDSTSKRGNTPFEFQIGAGKVIQGWEEGACGMKVGGKRKLTIPPGLGYGASGAGKVIPPNATLIFEIELLQVK